ncbi:MAG: hypothetical protein WC454_09430 [Phycisphaerae bacterium]|jgi:hypothetical protein
MNTEKTIVAVNLSGRNKNQISDMLRQECHKKTGSTDLKSLDLGFELPADFLQLGDSQPSLAQLTVLAEKLGMQIQIEAMSLVPFTELVKSKAVETAKSPTAPVNK